MGKHFRTVSGATFVSRIAGFARDQINAALFGAGWVTDAYFMAVRIPNLLRDLFAEGALSSAFIPTLTGSLEKEGRARALRLAREVFTLLLLVVGGLCALGILFAPQLVAVIAHGFKADPPKFLLTVELTRILFPVLLFVSLAALWMGFLNAHQRFTVPAFAPVAMNLTLIVTGVVLLTPLFRKGGDHDLTLVYVWTAATTVGMLMQWLVQAPQAAKFGFRPRLAWPPAHPGVKRMLSLMGPAVVSLSVIQVNLLINQVFASFLPTGGVTHLYYGNRLMQLPYGVLAVSIATVVFPLMSRQAARGDRGGFAATLSRALEAALFVMLPATVGLVIVSGPLSRLAFQYGRFTLEAAQAVAEATAFYSIGLFAYAAVKVLVPAYYAHHKTRWPVAAALAAMAANIGLNAAAFLLLSDPRHRFWGLALASSLGAFVNMAVLLSGLPGLSVKLEWSKMVAEASRIGLATLALVLTAGGTLVGLSRLDLPFGRAFEALAPALLGAVVYFYASRSLRCRSLEWIFARRGRR